MQLVKYCAVYNHKLMQICTKLVKPFTSESFIKSTGVKTLYIERSDSAVAWNGAKG
jgi:hypothetical protein